MLPPDLPPRKLNTKLVKETKDVKYAIFTPLLPEKIPFEGELLKTIPKLKFEDNDFNDHKKYLQFAPSRYVKQVHYLERGVTRFEPHQ